MATILPGHKNSKNIYREGAKVAKEILQTLH